MPYFVSRRLQRHWGEGKGPELGPRDWHLDWMPLLLISKPWGETLSRSYFTCKMGASSWPRFHIVVRRCRHDAGITKAGHYHQQRPY